jgi:hypothetical protein
MSQIVYAGALCEVPGVATWMPSQHGMTWRAGTSRVRVRTVPESLICLHATDGEGDARQVYRTLSAKSLSVEFVVERGGRVVQFLDPARFQAAHVGGLNARAIGIEIVCRVHADGNPWRRPVSSQIVQVVDAQGNWHRSNRRECLGLLPAQTDALHRLVDWLCSATGITNTLADQRDYVPPAERAALRGVIGHAQVATEHGDPPLDAMALFRSPT